MVSVLGIDPSSKKLALCLTGATPGNNPVLRTVSLPAGALQATGAAYREAFLFFQSCFENGEILHVYMEAPVVGRNIGSTVVQAQVGGAVMAAAQNTGVSLYLVNNMTWKKRVVGKGNARKEDTADKLREIWPEAYAACRGDQDLIDACALNRFGVGNRRLAESILTRGRRRGDTEG